MRRSDAETDVGGAPLWCAAGSSGCRACGIERDLSTAPPGRRQDAAARADPCGEDDPGVPRAPRLRLHGRAGRRGRHARRRRAAALPRGRTLGRRPGAGARAAARAAVDGPARRRDGGHRPPDAHPAGRRYGAGAAPARPVHVRQRRHRRSGAPAGRRQGRRPGHRLRPRHHAPRLRGPAWRAAREPAEGAPEHRRRVARHGRLLDHRGRPQQHRHVGPLPDGAARHVGRRRRRHPDVRDPARPAPRRPAPLPGGQHVVRRRGLHAARAAGVLPRLRQRPDHRRRSGQRERPGRTRTSTRRSSRTS